MAAARSLRTQVLVLQLGVVGITLVVAGAMAMWLHARSVAQATQDHLRSTATAVAALPSILEGFEAADPPAEIQQVAELVRKSGSATQVVVTDAAGRRYSHPNPALIGSVDPFDSQVPQAGEMWVDRIRSVHGEVLRAKVPVYGKSGEVIGSVSVGRATAAMRAEMWGELPYLLPWLLGVALAGTIGARAVSSRVWRRVHRQEPEEIAGALQARDAVLHAIGEAVVVIDAGGIITLVNDEATRLFGLDASAVGRPAAMVLEPGILAALSAPLAPGPSPQPGGTSAAKPEDDPSSPRLLLAGERLVVAQYSGAAVGDQAVGTVLVARDRSELLEALDRLAGADDLAEALRSQAHEFAGRMHVVAGLLELGEVAEARGYVTELCVRDAHLADVLAQVPDRRLRALLLAKAAMAAEREVRVEISVGAGVGQDYNGDAATVASNLLDNAIDAAGVGGAVQVRLEGWGGGDGLRLVVGDDGPGIPAPLRGAVVMTGFSTKGGGRGFGLALVERIVQRRGGRMVVGESGLGGAMVDVVLPAPDAVPSQRGPGGAPSKTGKDVPRQRAAAGQGR